jgi:quercetin dioxygenase-like cupin family protein
MSRFVKSSVAVAALVLAAASAPSRPESVVTPQGQLQWKNAGVPGVDAATVAGDSAKGPSRFYLRYKAGLSTPVHHHSADHYVTTVTGTLLLKVDGKEHRLPPGSYFSLTGKAAHSAKVEGSEDCVMFIDAHGPWDVVAEK